MANKGKILEGALFTFSESFCSFLLQIKNNLRNRKSFLRLLTLARADFSFSNNLSFSSKRLGTTDTITSQLSDRLGQAGFITKKQKQGAKTFLNLIILASVLCSLSVCLYLFSNQTRDLIGLFARLLLFGFIGIYLGFLIWLTYLKYKRHDYERRLLFFLPLSLESLILLVESGLGVLPAIGLIAERTDQDSYSNPVNTIFKLIYKLTISGIPFSTALEIISSTTNVAPLRHALLHLDVSATAGGELIPALRSLSEQSHIEWKLSVEARVRRLENTVVFPVFSAVIGLMLLAAAVPLVPVVNFMKELSQNQKRPYQVSTSLSFNQRELKGN